MHPPYQPTVKGVAFSVLWGPVHPFLGIQSPVCALYKWQAYLVAWQYK